MARPPKVSRALVAACLLAAVAPRAVVAQITSDGRFSTAGPLPGAPNYIIDASRGRLSGSNLFHSFGQFNLSNTPVPQTATFTAAGSPPASISNVISRVTGGNPSSIDGGIRSAITGANLYLINPSGIVFGPHATVNISGSFYASTADYLKLKDGTKFQATNPDASSSTLSAMPEAFGFLTATPANITVNGSALGVPAGQTLGLVARGVSINPASPPDVPKGATLLVPAGTIHVTSVGSTGTGEVPVDPRNVSTVTSFGPVDIRGGSTVSTRSTLNVSDQQNRGSGGSVFIRAGALTINAGEINGDNYGSNTGGILSLRGDSQVTLSGSTSVHAVAQSAGRSPDIVVATAGPLAVRDSSTISASTLGSGAGGDVSVTAGSLMITSLTTNGSIASNTSGAGNAGNVWINVSGDLSIVGSSSLISVAGITTFSTSTGNAGNVTVNAGTLRLATQGLISADTLRGSGHAGSVAVNVAGELSIDGTSQRLNTGILSRSGPGSGKAGEKAGEVNVSAGSLAITNGGQIATQTFGPASGGDIGVTVTGDVVITGRGGIPLPTPSAITAAAQAGSSGGAGKVILTAGGAIALSDRAQITSSTIGAGSLPAARGDAGSVTATAPQITLTSGAQIASTTAGMGKGGSVNVTTSGALVLDGAGVANTQIAASAMGSQSGPGGSVTVGAGSLTVEGGAQIASSTAGPGKGGDIAVTVVNGVTLSGSNPNGASGISAAALAGSSGAAGEVVLTAGGAIALSGGAEITSSTAGVGRGGSVQVTAGGLLSLTNPGSGIIASATSAARGDAGSVIASAPQITLTSGGEIASTTAGTGAGGSVNVTTPGALALDGGGVANTQIAASATGPQSGQGGSVTVSAGSLTIEGGAQIASSTAGLGKGGDVNVMVASDILLPDPGPQITALSTGSGDAGLITVSATRLLLNDGGRISTEAQTANGGNITLKVSDFLYLTNSQITTSVNRETGNGGNITIDPQLVILNHSNIVAQAAEGQGGNITINAGLYIASTDSIVSASSQFGVSGTVVINGPQVDVNGALVVLSSELRGRAAVLTEACSARSDRPISSLVEAGRGGLPQDPEATLPALYIAGRDLTPDSRALADTTELGYTALHTMARLTIRCG